MVRRQVAGDSVPRDMLRTSTSHVQLALHSAESNSIACCVVSDANARSKGKQGHKRQPRMQ